MAAALIAVFQALLKQQLEPTIQDQIDWQDFFLEDVVNTPGLNKAGVKRNMANNSFEITSKNSGTTAYAGSEAGALINSDLSFEKMNVVPKYVRARTLLSHTALVATMGSEAAISSAASEYGLDIRKAMMRAKGRHIRGDGTGIVGTLADGVVSSATHAVLAKAPGTIVSQAKYNLGTQYFMVGQELTIGTAAQFAAGTATNVAIASVNSDTSLTFTASVALGSAAGANNHGGTNASTYYVRFKGEYGNVPMGIMGLCDNGTIVPGLATLQGLTRSTTPYMKSTVLDKANASTIIKDFRDLYVAVTRYNKKGMKYFAVSDDVYGKYTDSITITNQSNPSMAQYTSKLGTGHTGLMFAYGSSPIPILYDSDLPSGTVLLLDTDQLFCSDLFEDAFVPDGVMARVSGSTDYETIRAAYYNFGTFSARKLGGQINYQAV